MDGTDFSVLIHKEISKAVFWGFGVFFGGGVVWGFFTLTVIQDKN